jgi:hypothetical protein
MPNTSHTNKLSSQVKRYNLIQFFTLFSLMLSACSSTEIDSQQATVQALEARLAATVTAQGSSVTPDSAIQDAQATATQVSGNLISTQTAQADLDASGAAATASAFSTFEADLSRYRVDPQKGRPGFIHPPVTLELDEFHSTDFANQFLGTVAEDFVFSSDITWNTQYGTSGCGFILRSNGEESFPDQYLVIATRAASGHIVFGVIVDGELVGGQDFYAYGLDPSFDFHNDATNRIAVVGRGQRFEIYSNGTLIGEVDPNDPLPQPRIPDPPPLPIDINNPKLMGKYTQARAEYDLVVQKIKADFAARLKSANQADKNFERGFVAMLAASESGLTQCKFDRTWLWLIEE